MSSCATVLGARGTCATGTVTCVAGSWGPCSISPTGADTCAPGNDDSCNGVPNESCICINGAVGTCGDKLSAKGTCAAGATTCTAGAWGACSVQPRVADTCDLGNDDTCDGQANTGCVCDGFSLPTDHPNPTDYDTSIAGVVTDRMTGLMWERNPGSSTFNQSDAVAHCAALTVAGFSDWRLPTVLELVSIVDFTVTSPSINSAAFPATSQNYYWSVTPYAPDPGYTWVIRFINGDASQYLNTTTFPIPARCVR